MANRDPDNPGDGNNPEDNGTYTTKVVISELLCYAMSNIQRCNGDQIIKAINQYYNLQEIVSAKKILYEIYRDDLGEYPKRKTSRNRSEQLAHVEDIIDSLLYLDTKDNRPDLNFAAVDLNRLPRWNPNETDHFAIAEKLVALQAWLENIEFVASENKASCIRNRDDISELTKKIDKTTAVSYAQAASNANIDKERMSTQLSVPLARDSRFQGQVQGEIQERDYRWPWQQKETQQSGKAAQQRQQRAHASIASRPDQSHKPLQPETPADSQNEDGAETNTAEEEGFQKSSHERKKEARRKRLVINGKAPVTRLKGSPPVTRDFFVYRVDKTTTDDDMKNHLHDLEINYVSVNRLLNVEATYCSYRISVPLDQVDKIMDANGLLE